MVTSQRMFKNLYRDSVSLMQFSAQLGALKGITKASAVMATANNLSLLVEAGLLAAAPQPSPNDLLIAIQGGDQEEVDAALAQAESMLARPREGGTQGAVAGISPRSIEMGLRMVPDANLALVSTPGEYAAAEARKALQLGMHVMIFSDNVSIEQEIPLKEYARDHGLLVMGPDCGTAILNGIPLGFADVVRRGDIGIVAAAGTGLQQVTTLIDRFGGGITQAIGTGGHDLSTQVGGITMLQGIAALARDPATKVIVLISKPPAPAVMKNVLQAAAETGKPVVVDFIGADPASLGSGRVFGVRTLADAATFAVQLSKGRQPGRLSSKLSARRIKLAKAAAKGLGPRQKYIRCHFSGGTFCYETVLLLSEHLGTVYSNTPLRPEGRLTDVWKSRQHTALDFGDDLFTQGRPHPMIDFRLRNERILQEARDPDTALLLLDIVLGYGAHPNPAGELVPAVVEAQRIARRARRQLVFVGSVCGTESDPQVLSRQEAALREAGMLLTDSNAEAARLAAEIIGASIT